jgi:ABC-type Na+ efflux pump permease subunit
MTGVLITSGILIGLLLALIYLSFGNLPGKTMAVAQAAYRETIRQPLFWFLLVFSIIFMLVSVFLPYFTLGEDLKMMKDLQLDAILLPTLILCIFVAALSISEEIEGRTAITLLSKPVARWQFLFGKYIGIMLAGLLMALLLTLVLGFSINFKIQYEGLEDELPGKPQEVAAIKEAMAKAPTAVGQPLEHALMIVAAIKAMAPGPLLVFCQVVIMTALATALATRLPLVVNLVICFAFFFMGRLTPVLVQVAQDNALVKFIAQVFGLLLPDLGPYDVGPTLAHGHSEIPWIYIFQAWVQGLFYAAIALILGLILFEDRDLA